MKLTSLAVTIATVAIAGPAMAVSDWTSTAGVQAVYGSYGGSVQRDKIAGYGIVITSDYLESGGFTLGLNRTDIKMKSGVRDIGQNALFASGRMHFTPDGIAGRITARMDLHVINNNDRSGDTDEVTAYAPQLSFLAYDKSYAFDLGYAHSRYLNDLRVDQWTPAFGFAMNNGADWLQLRGWFIDPSNAARAQGKNSTAALEAKFTHWFGPAKPLGLDNLRASLMVGERVYAVDGDAGVVFNLADIQRGGASLGAEWKFGGNTSLLAVFSRDRMRNATLADDYNLTSGYLWLAVPW